MQKRIKLTLFLFLFLFSINNVFATDYFLNFTQQNVNYQKYMSNCTNSFNAPNASCSLSLGGYDYLFYQRTGYIDGSVFGNQTNSYYGGLNTLYHTGNNNNGASYILLDEGLLNLNKSSISIACYQRNSPQLCVVFINDTNQCFKAFCPYNTGGCPTGVTTECSSCIGSNDATKCFSNAVGAGTYGQLYRDMNYFGASEHNQQNVKYIGIMSVHQAAVTTSEEFIYWLNISNVSVNDYNNSLPGIDILNQKSVYCYNESTNQYFFDLTATDTEGDTIYYYDYWNDDFEGEVLIDDFSDSDYSMSANGWAFNGTGCNYSTNEGYLELYSQCQNISMIKWLDSKELSGEDLKVSFQAWAFRNTTNTYEIWNWQNEKIGGLKVATYFDSLLNAIYTNFSYWNGSTYLYFNQSYYVGLFGFDFYMNDTHLRICGSGLDENLASWENCKYELIEELHGTTNNIPAKFYMSPTYNNMWENYEPSYVVLDELSYQWTEIDWLTYNLGDSVSHVFTDEGQEILNILVTDNIHTPDYTKYVFPITVFGDCANELNTTTDLNLTGWDEIGEDFLSSVGDGKNKFNTIFYIFLFLAIIYMLYNGFNFEIAAIVVGWIGIAITFVLSGGMVAFISSASLIALGLGIILTRVFV